MKLVVAIIRPEKLEAVQEELLLCEIDQMTVSEVLGCGRRRGPSVTYRGTTFRDRFLPMIKLEIALNNAFAGVAVKAILRSSRSGRVGDGKIFVMPLEDCFRIRNWEHGMAAVCR